jgi:8-oxo-dGTP diphosphatase
MMLTRTVTCFIVQSSRVLLQKRPAGKLWAGMLNGPGGKVNPGERAADAIIREVLEETGLQIVNPEPRGSLFLHIPSPKRVKLSVDIFIVNTFHGNALEREGVLSWYDRDELPFEAMWADQKYWLRAVLDGLSVDGKVRYEPDSLRLTQCQLRLRLPSPALPSQDHLPRV